MILLNISHSANRRLSLPQAFLAVDAILLIYRNIVEGIEVFPKVIEKNLNEVLPFMATEEILMAGVRAGGDRQELHEAIRVHSLDAAEQVKVHGTDNDLIDPFKSAFSLLDWQRRHSVRVDRAQKLSPEELEGKIVTGIIHRREAPEYTQLYHALTESFQKPVERMTMEREY